MLAAPPLGIWWLPLFCAMGCAIAYLMLRLDDRVDASYAAMARTAAQIGGVGGVWYWLIVDLFGWSRSVMVAPYRTRDYLAAMAMEAVLWGLVGWPFAAWRMERELKAPLYRSTEQTTRLVVAMVIVFAVAYVAHHELTQLWLQT
jgi:hypothetical protein